MERSLFIRSVSVINTAGSAIGVFLYVTFSPTAKSTLFRSMGFEDAAASASDSAADAEAMEPYVERKTLLTHWFLEIDW
uniref:Uncharacterized protein n=1 Tax=Leersia perrieri TaxID=77586 RepID=A0A0D9WHV2_9ORYZ